MYTIGKFHRERYEDLDTDLIMTRVPSIHCDSVSDSDSMRTHLRLNAETMVLDSNLQVWRYDNISLTCSLKPRYVTIINVLEKL